MRHHLRHSLALIGLGAISGCSDLFGPHGPEITVSLDVEAAVGGTWVFRSAIGGRRVEVTADAARGGHASTEARGDRYGTVPVHAILLLTFTRDSVSAVSFSQEFQRGYSHWVAAHVGSHRPLGICVGEVAAAPLAAGSTDTLFVMHGSIPNGAVC